MSTQRLTEKRPAASTFQWLRWINYKWIIFGLLALDIALFGNLLLIGLGHSLQLLIEVIEVALEHFLESAFDLSPRQAQFVLAYSALVLGLGILAYAMRVAYLATIRAWIEAKALALKITEQVKIARKNATWKKISLALGAFGATFFLLS
jgi:hypothetical protein